MKFPSVAQFFKFEFLKLPNLHKYWRFCVYVLSLCIASIVLLGLYWSIPPKLFSVSEATQTELRALKVEQSVAGFSTTTTLIKVIETLLYKPGGYLLNDRFPPGLWLDNMPHWEYGVLIQARDLTRVMRRSLARSQSQSSEDKNLAAAEPYLNTDPHRWLLPAAEREYKKGIDELKSFQRRLVVQGPDTAHFYARADNLADWMGEISKRLGSLSQRLSASVGQKQIFAEDRPSDQEENFLKTSWFEIDDIFYEARGSSWALIHFLKAAEIDFKEVLEKKNALISLRQIIRDLESSQATLWSPMVLNGSGFGILVNHSLTMAAYLSQANAALIELKDLLEKG